MSKHIPNKIYLIYDNTDDPRAIWTTIKEREDDVEFVRATNDSKPVPVKIINDVPDYDTGIINDYGGGNVDWWMDYIRAEIGRCNEYWREYIEGLRDL